MATLVSPGVSVSVINESFFIPVSAPTVPLIFVATREGKLQTNGKTIASGSLEAGVVRTVTSLTQSLALYGVPHFRKDSSGNEYHGDARNEYGLFALNQFLNQGDRAYVVRADIDLNDEPVTFLSLGIPVEVAGSRSFNGIGNGVLGPVTAFGSLVRPQTISITITTPPTVDANGAPVGAMFTVTGSVDGYIGQGETDLPFSSNFVNFTLAAGTTHFAAGDKFLFSLGNTWVPSGGSSISGLTPGAGNTGNGTFLSLIPDVFAQAETYTITFTSATAFSVASSVSGAWTGSVTPTNVPSNPAFVKFDNNRVEFSIYAGSTPFVAGDTFTFNVTVGANIGNGKISGLAVTTHTVPETLSVQFTSPTQFDVRGSVSGTMGSGTVGALFSHTNITFTVTAGTTPFAAGEQYDIVITEVTITSPLGTSDGARRLAIVTALQAQINSNTEVRSPLYEYNLILCPGYPETVDEMLSLSVAVFEEALVLADTPSHMTPDQVAQWALTSERRSNTNAAYYYPWGLASNLDGRDVMIAPSGIALATITYSDNVGYVWTPPAGIARGVVTGVSKTGYVSGNLGTATTFVESVLSQGQLDNLYEYDKNINPITFFPGRGILVWGQKTSAPAASALDRINVVRLVMYLRRSLRKGALPFVFEPNDQLTRDNLKTASDGIMNDILVKRGLTDYASICDGSNNTPDRIDRNELWLDVAIKPTRAAEFIYIPIRVLSTSAAI
jgi:hypothetical protein